MLLGFPMISVVQDCGLFWFWCSHSSPSFRAPSTLFTAGLLSSVWRQLTLLHCTVDLLFFHSIFTVLSDQTGWSCFHSINYVCLTLPRCFLYLSYFTLLLIVVIESLEYMSNSQDQLQDMPNQQFCMSQHRTCFASTHSSSFSLGSELDKNVKKPHILYKLFRDQTAEGSCR